MPGRSRDHVCGPSAQAIYLELLRMIGPLLASERSPFFLCYMTKVQKVFREAQN